MSMNNDVINSSLDAYVKDWDDEHVGNDLSTLHSWSLSPEIIDVSWSESENIPAPEFVSVVFPFFEVTEGRKLTYSIRVEESVVEFFSISHTHTDFSDITLSQNRKIGFYINWKNFNRLKNGNNTSFVYFEVAENVGSSEKVLTSRKIIVNVNKRENEIMPQISPDKSSYYIFYDKFLKKYTGDTHIRFLRKNFSDELERTTYIDLQKVEHDFMSLFVIDSEKNYVFGECKGIEDKELGEYKLGYQASLKYNSYSSHDAGGEICHSVVFNIIIRVVDSSSEFSVSKQEFALVLNKDENLKASGFFIVTKNEGVSFLAVAPDILLIRRESVSSREEKIYFSSKRASELKAGINKMSVWLHFSNGISRRVIITIDVIEKVSYLFSEYIFCLDYNPMTIRKVEDESELVKLKIDMLFSGYGKHYTISQEYESVFFRDRATFLIGEDIQDFFMEISNLKALNINQDGHLEPSELYFAAVVDVKIQESDFRGKLYREYNFEGLRFLPGKKPKAFPYLTNSKVRKTYSNSLISLSSLGVFLKNNKLGAIGGYNLDNTSVLSDFGVYNLSFRRFTTDYFYGKNKTISNNHISLEPFPEPADCIDVIFVNQNLCPDWLSFSGEWERHPELNHILSNNKRGVVFKAKVESKNVLKLNTGWLLEEEVVLVEELMKSKFCFVKLKEKWMRCIPISKKPLVYDSDRNMNSQIVEFQIAEEDER